MPKVAIVHPFLRQGQDGGGESMTFLLRDELDADLYVISYDASAWHDDSRVEGIKPIFSDYRIPKVRKVIRDILTTQRFLQTQTKIVEELNNNYDTVIFTDDAGDLPQLVTKPKTIYYRHNDPVWYGYEKLNYYYKWLDERYTASLKSVDVVISNSKYTQENLKDKTKINSKVVHPPVSKAPRKKRVELQDYYLSTARLDGYKNIDKTITAFKELPDEKLIIVNTGPEQKKLERMSAKMDNVQLLGQVTKDKYWELIHNCKAGILVPDHNEAFSIAAAEFSMANKHVLATTDNGQSEALGPYAVSIISQNIAKDLVAKINDVDKHIKKVSEEKSKKHKAKFGHDKFIKEFKKIL